MGKDYVFQYGYNKQTPLAATLWCNASSREEALLKIKKTLEYGELALATNREEGVIYLDDEEDGVHTTLVIRLNNLDNYDSCTEFDPL